MNPLAGVEDTVVAHPWWAVGALALTAACSWAADLRGGYGSRRLVKSTRSSPSAHQSGTSATRA